MTINRSAILPILAMLAAFWLPLEAKEIIRPIGKKIVQESIVGSAAANFKSDVSRRNILGLDRPTPYSLPTGKRGRPIAEVLQEDTVHVLVLKVEFQEEIPDFSGTTGTGIFDLRTHEEFRAEEGHDIDPAPHNSAYFNSHMEALRRYWYFVSDKTLDLTWDIYPLETDAAFRLPVPMAYYGSSGPWADSSIGDRLGNFTIDAITFVDSAAPEIDFSRYQSILFFHAGADQQNNIDFINNTPDDFFTGFLRLAEPVEVDEGADSVYEAILMPETASQDNRVNAINAVMAHEFGHQLGLVDLYNTLTFFTQVGDFSLMDNNGFSVGVQFEENGPIVGGAMPIFPDAWSRAYLGFNIPRVTSRVDEEVVSAAVQHYSEDEIIQVPITDFEYFLIENREQVDPNTALIGDPDTYVILGPGYLSPEDLIVANGEYDLLIPGNGMLIWHIDEYVAYLSYVEGSDVNNFYFNTLQWDRNRRFVSLVEADGIIDFGGNYYTGFGTDAEFFKAGNNTSCTPFTRPSTHSNLGSDSHIFITNISEADTFMTVDIDNDWLLPGWPQMSRPGTLTDPVIADLNADSSGEVIMGGGNQLIVWKEDGAKLINNTDFIGIQRYDSSIAVYPLAVIADCDTTIIGRPLPIDFNDDDQYEIAVATVSGRIYAYECRDNNSDGRADLIEGFPIDIGYLSTSPLIAVNFLERDGAELLTFGQNDRIRVIYTDLDGSDPLDSLISPANYAAISAAAFTTDAKNFIYISNQLDGAGYLVRLSANLGSLAFVEDFSLNTGLLAPHYLATGDLNRDGSQEVVIALEHAIKLIGGDGIEKWSYNLYNPGQPVLGDINSDGFPEIVVADSCRIYAFAYNGIVLDNFPINLAFYDLNASIVAEPLIGDVDNDGNPDIIAGLPTGTVHAFNYHGDKISGFPLPSSFGISKACALGDLNNDNKTDLILAENSGMVKAWNTTTTASIINNPWSMAGGDINNSGYLSGEFLKPVTISDTQLPENSVYNYPNPAQKTTAIRYYLNQDSDVKIDIYDYMGESVHSANVDGQAHADNEYIWDCHDAASGIYFCRVEADGGSGKTWRIFKIAIVK